MKTKLCLSYVFALALGLCMAAMETCQAQSVFNVSLNTVPLIGDPNGPFSIDFQFIDGIGTGDSNNSVTLSNFAFAGGSGTGAPTLTGGASGDLASTVILTDSNFFTEFYQTFTPGSTLDFQVSLTTNLDTGGIPDEFSFALLDNALNEIPTTDVGGAFVVTDITSAAPTIQTFAATSPYLAIGTPTISTSQATQTPEPGVLSLPLGFTVFGAGFILRRRRTKLSSRL